MQKHTALLFSLLIVFSLPAHSETTACSSGQEIVQQLSPTAQSIQALNVQLAATGRSVAPHAFLSAGEKSLLAKRRDLIEQLMREHPEQVRSVMLDPAQSSALIAADPSAAALIESDTQLTGELAITVADDFQHGTATHYYHLHTRTGDTDLFPTSSFPLDSLLHKLVSVSGLATSAAMAVETAHNVVVHPNVPSGASPPPPLNCSILGVQKTAVLILNFAGGTVAYPANLGTAAYWQQAVAGLSDPSVTNFWSEASYGQTSATADVYGPFTLPQVYDCTTLGPMQTAAFAAAAGIIDFSQYTRFVLVYPVASCGFGGVGSVGCYGATSSISHTYSVAWIPVLPTDSTTNFAGDLTHELGHNLGLNHANTLDFGSISLGPLDFQQTGTGAQDSPGETTTASVITAVSTEYGDTFSTMGGSAFGTSGPYSAQHRAKLLNWIPYIGTRYVTTGGTYTLVPTENSSGIRALRVLRDPISGSSLWIEYHQPIGHYESANLAAYVPNNIAQGANIHYDDGFGNPAYTYQLDMTPIATGNNFYDGNLLPGKTWSDPYSLLNITTNSATSAGLNVSVSYSTPCATLALSPASIPAAGGTGTLTITAPSTCTWTVSSNASWITLGQTTSGMGNGTVTYTATPNTTQDQRATYISAQRQSLQLIQEGSTANLLGVTPNSGSAAGGTSTVFTVSLDDSSGFSDLYNINFYLTSGGFGSVDCSVQVGFSGTSPYYFLFDNTIGVFTSSISGGTTGSISTSACTLSAKNSGLVISGNTIHISMDLSFPVTSPGLYSMFANIGSHVHPSNTLPVGTFIVNGTPSVGFSPSTANQGNTVPAAVIGYETHFTSASILTFDTPSITAQAANTANPTALTFALSIAPNTTPGAHTLRITTGSEVVTSPFTVTVPVLSSTTLSGPASSVLPGTAVTLTAVVNGGTGTKPSGIVTFFDGTTTLGTATLDGTGTATYTSSSFALGTHPITAVYSGDTIYGQSTSTVVNIIVAKDQTSTTLTGPTASVLPGTSVSLTAVVSGAVSTKPTGTITFMDGSTTLGTAALDGTGTATYSSSSLALGTHPITAVYGGDTIHSPSTSALINVIIAKGAITLAVTTTATQAFAGNSLTFTATATATGGVPSGTVTFFDNTPSTVLGTGTLSGSGVATLSLTNLGTGAHAIGFTYPGSSIFNAGTSATIPVTVSDFTISAPANLSFAAGASTGNTATITVTPGAGGFSSAISLSCSGAPSASTCTISPPTVTPGGANATATLTVATTARAAIETGRNDIQLALPLFGFLLVGLPVIAIRRRSQLATFLSLTLLLTAGIVLNGCGSSASTSPTPPPSGTPAGSSILTITGGVTGASGTLTHTTSITVTVN